jgi:hypothetical protein
MNFEFEIELILKIENVHRFNFSKASTLNQRSFKKLKQLVGEMCSRKVAKYSSKCRLKNIFTINIGYDGIQSL